MGRPVLFELNKFKPTGYDTAANWCLIAVNN
jgi:hypothetical protein